MNNNTRVIETTLDGRTVCIMDTTAYMLSKNHWKDVFLTKTKETSHATLKQYALASFPEVLLESQRISSVLMFPSVLRLQFPCTVLSAQFILDNASEVEDTICIPTELDASTTKFNHMSRVEFDACACPETGVITLYGASIRFLGNLRAEQPFEELQLKVSLSGVESPEELQDTIRGSLSSLPQEERERIDEKFFPELQRLFYLQQVLKQLRDVEHRVDVLTNPRVLSYFVSLASFDFTASITAESLEDAILKDKEDTRATSRF